MYFILFFIGIAIGLIIMSIASWNRDNGYKKIIDDLYKKLYKNLPNKKTTRK